MKRKLGMIAAALVVILVTLGLSSVLSERQTVFINEVRSWDSAAVRDGYYGSDYIELYNASEKDISLHGWYLSDDASDLKKCQLYDVTIGAKGFVLIYANGKNNSGDSLNFKLNPAGEKIFLSNAQGNLVDSVYVPEQEFGTVYARMTDGAAQWCVKEETTDYSNNDAQVLLVRSLEEPVFSHESGFYEEAFLLNIAAGEDETIYYTLDGSVPTEASAVFEAPISIEDISDQPNVCNQVQNVVTDWKNYTPGDVTKDKAVIVRAVAMDGAGNASDVVSHTYFVDQDQYRDKNVVSLIADYEDLFGDQGIFVTGAAYDEAYLSGTLDDTVQANFLKRGRRWEIQGNVQVLESGEEILNQKAGIRTQGASTRLNPKKRMSIYSREEYSKNDYFEGFSLNNKSIHSVMLNPAAANVLLPALVKDRNVAVQEAAETVVFLNGEYWYDCFTMEKYSEYYLEETYGVGRDNVIIMKDSEVSEGPENSQELYGQLIAFVENTDLSIDENYSQLERLADMQSYIDYICANIYWCNMDVSETKNYVLWRTVENEGTAMGDTRWRWMLYDTDCLEWIDKSYYDAEARAAINSFAETMQFTGVAINEHLLYSSAKSNPKFCEDFVITFMDMANVNFSTENIEKIFGEWGYEADEFGDFFKERFDYIVPYMAEEFQLTGTLEDVTLKVNDTAGGTILLNTTTPNMSEGSWSGKYYTDYPVTVTAMPAEGYEFVGWSGSMTSDSVTIEAEVLPGGITLEAVFEKTAN